MKYNSPLLILAFVILTAGSVGRVEAQSSSKPRNAKKLEAITHLRKVYDNDRRALLLLATADLIEALEQAASQSTGNPRLTELQRADNQNQCHIADWRRYDEMKRRITEMETRLHAAGNSRVSAKGIAKADILRRLGSQDKRLFGAIDLTDAQHANLRPEMLASIRNRSYLIDRLRKGDNVTGQLTVAFAQPSPTNARTPVKAAASSTSGRPATQNGSGYLFIENTSNQWLDLSVKADWINNLRGSADQDPYDQINISTRSHNKGRFSAHGLAPEGQGIKPGTVASVTYYQPGPSAFKGKWIQKKVSIHAGDNYVNIPFEGTELAD